MRLAHRLVPRPPPATGGSRQGLRRLAATFLIFVVAGCARTSTPVKRETVASTPVAANTPDAPAERILGTVHVIGTGGRWVLVQAPAAALVAALADGQTLVCRAAGSVTATLRVSAERRPPFVVADVVTGTPNLGDEAFIEPAGNHATPTPAANLAPAAPPSSTPEFRTNPGLPAGR